MATNPISAILRDKNSVLWRQDYGGKEIGFDSPIVEACTSRARAAMRAISSAPVDPVIITDNRDRPSEILPSLHAAWPKMSTLPHSMSIDTDAAWVIQALADAAKSLTPRGRHTRKDTGPYVLAEASGEHATRVTMHNAPGKLVALVDGWSTRGPALPFRIQYLADALQGDAADVHYDTPVRPFVVVNRGVIPSCGGYRSCIACHAHP